MLIDETNTILAGHGRVAAAKLLGLATVPCRPISTMTAAQKRAYVLADNKLALNAGWDEEMLADRAAAGCSTPSSTSTSASPASRSPRSTA